MEPARRILTRLPVPTRDGVDLCTDVYLPESGAPAPAVVARTPYGRATPFLLHLALRLNRAGLAVVLQDCRGRSHSGGRADWRREESDGFDTLAWVGAQPWCSGRVGLVGVSISSLPLFPLAAGRAPDGVEVGALVNIMGVVDFRSTVFRDGALVLHWVLPWLHLMGPGRASRDGWQAQPWSEVFSTVPLADAPTREPFDHDLWREVLTHPDPGEAWDGLDARGHLHAVRAPTLHVGGWYDFLLPHVLRAYEGIAAGASRAAGSQTLVVGPWDHQSLFSRGAVGVELPDLVVRHLERSLSGNGARAAGEDPPEARPGVLLYVMERERWLAFDRFPPEGSRRAEWFLASGGRANSARGDGRLVLRAPAGAAEDAFVYDPRSPVSTVGGGVWPFEAAGLGPGAADQSGVEGREDVLVYTSAPLEEDVVAVGPVEAELWVSSSACATDFTAKLVDVDPGGLPRVVQDGILRIRPGEADLRGPTRLTVDLGATGWCFRSGHRVRLEVASSNFPKYDRHFNGPEPPCFSTGGASATQRVFHGGARPSLLRVTVVPGESAREAEIDPGASTRTAVPSRGSARTGASPYGTVRPNTAENRR